MRDFQLIPHGSPVPIEDFAAEIGTYHRFVLESDGMASFSAKMEISAVTVKQFKGRPYIDLRSETADACIMGVERIIKAPCISGCIYSIQAISEDSGTTDLHILKCI